ncbi:DUF5994 family protein [Mycobacterium sp. Z3061]|uniref:DUF5994 family protein n=1 Tax=Mycobacterium sp. Z3061 TaxID=3073562 RepID=UPI002877662B|nr:DUF5994 family protein [Mycobacterium sp. Z3061]
MAPRNGQLEAGNRHPPPEHTPRLKLKPKAPLSGYVDGAWQPRSDRLETELPDLLSVLSVRLGPICRVIYNVGEWRSSPAKFRTGGRVVRLDGYSRQPANTVEIIGLNRNKVVLLVVSPETEPTRAHSLLMTAAGPNNAATVEDLLAHIAD